MDLPQHNITAPLPLTPDIAVKMKEKLQWVTIITKRDILLSQRVHITDNLSIPNKGNSKFPHLVQRVYKETRLTGTWNPPFLSLNSQLLDYELIDEMWRYLKEQEGNNGKWEKIYDEYLHKCIRAVTNSFQEIYEENDIIKIVKELESIPEKKGILLHAAQENIKLLEDQLQLRRHALEAVAKICKGEDSSTHEAEWDDEQIRCAMEASKSTVEALKELRKEKTELADQLRRKTEELNAVLEQLSHERTQNTEDRKKFYERLENTQRNHEIRAADHKRNMEEMAVEHKRNMEDLNDKFMNSLQRVCENHEKKTADTHESNKKEIKQLQTTHLDTVRARDRNFRDDRNEFKNALQQPGKEALKTTNFDMTINVANSRNSRANITKKSHKK